MIILEEGIPPPPTVTPMRHDGDMEGLKWAARHHRSVCQRGGAEETAVGRKEYLGERGEGLSGLRKAYGRPLAMVTSFKYLGQVLTLAGDD